MVINIIGVIAGAVTTLAYVPQVYKSYRIKHTGDLSWTWLLMVLIGVFLWIIYGITLNELPIIGANVFTFLFVLTLCLMKYKYDKNAKRKSL